MQVPDPWRDLHPSGWESPILLLGDTDTGKSTAVRLIYERLRRGDSSVAVIDGDPGQSTLGPPTTLTAALPSSSDAYSSEASLHHSFVGATTPRGHMLEVVVGARRLLEAVRADGADTVLYDTTGFITVQHGGRALKYALIDLLSPFTIVALQRQTELEPIITPLRHRSRARLVELPVPAAVSRRSSEARRHRRAQRFAAYFEEASLQAIHWPEVAVFPNLDFAVDQLLAFVRPDGFTHALGRIEAIDRTACTLTVETPLSSFSPIDTLRLGDICLAPDTFEDRPR